MLVILSGVAGAGKDTIKKEIVKRMEKVETIPSLTDRPIRPRRYTRANLYICKYRWI